MRAGERRWRLYGKVSKCLWVHVTTLESRVSMLYHGHGSHEPSRFGFEDRKHLLLIQAVVGAMSASRV
jgi:hypothetical protein